MRCPALGPGCFLVPLLTTSAAALAAPPAGQSALLNGMHDIQSLSWMATATDGCDKGWITDLQYIGQSGTAAGECRAEATAQGISLIMRLDVDGSHSYPTSADGVAGYAAAFADFVGDCAAIHVWVVGNEPNYTVGASDPDCSAPGYGAAYAAVHAAVHVVAGHESDLVLVAPNSPYSPGCLQSLRAIISEVQSRGVSPDGFALHAYTRAATGGALDASYVTSGATQSDGTIDECGGGATWNDTWHSHFLIYRDYVAVIEAAGLGGRPVFITESGNACDVASGNDCYPDANVSYFQALYAEAASYNAGATTKIRAITPYRWTGYDDGTGRDFEIGARPGLLADLQAAFAARPSWTDVDCGTEPTSCSDDAGCPGMQICDLATSQCVATEPCDATGACPEGQLCRLPAGDCVPTCRGPAAMAITPAHPDPHAEVELDVSSTAGWAHVGLALVGPEGPIETGWEGYEAIAAVNHWRWSATTQGDGTHRATFTADPAAATVYGICYFQVGDPALPPGPDGGTGGGSGGTGGQGGTSTGAGSTDSGPDDGGCGCRAAGAPQQAGEALAALLAAAGVAARRRRRGG